MKKWVNHWDVILALLATMTALAVGAANLGAPSIWHDEAVQVFVAKSIVMSGKPILPSGEFHPVAPVFNYLMAGFIAVLGDAEWVVRLPSVLFSAANVIILFLLLRSLLGRTVAVVAAFFLATSPWAVAWAREARFYTCQQTFYLITVAMMWPLISQPFSARWRRYTVAAFVAYVLGLGVSLHSVLFLTPLCACAVILTCLERENWRRYVLLVLVGTVLAGATMMLYRFSLPVADTKAIFKEAGWFSAGVERWPYYVAWLWGNLGMGFFLLAVAGSLLMVWHEKREGLFIASAFWGPILALTFLLTYRIHRFMFFAFPFYVAVFSYGLVEAIRFCGTWLRSWGRNIMAFVLVLFLARLAVSEVRLLQSTFRAASGADTTLATRHPQWRKPCTFVRAHLADDVKVLTTTYVSTQYYVGRVDNWYPNRYLVWEAAETGVAGLKDTKELEAYLAHNPKGFFLAEWFRFLHFDFMAEDRAWVEAHMKRIDEASSGDVKLYCWGMEPAELFESKAVSQTR